MPNDYFQFKQFTIRQDRCAMKVTTDACIFGAWVSVPQGARRALDVGTGTGLLSLMLAQRFPELIIDAVEIDATAAEQAVQNVAASPFASRVRIVTADVREYRPEAPYDFVFSNPPYFNNYLLSPNNHRNLARHGTALSPEEFLSAVKRVVSKNGAVAVVLPKPQADRWLAQLEQRAWHLTGMLDIRRAGSGVYLCVLVCSRAVPTKVVLEQLDFQRSDGKLSPNAELLLQPFYLNL